LPFCAASFDTVVSTFPTPYIAQSAALRETARVLRPGGRLVVVGLLVQRERRWSVMPFNLATPSEPGIEACRSLAESAGLSVRLISRYDPPTRVPVFVAERGHDPLP
jgi:SAM-dependent methyltransferase